MPLPPGPPRLCRTCDSRATRGAGAPGGDTRARLPGTRLAAAVAAAVTLVLAGCEDAPPPPPPALPPVPQGTAEAPPKPPKPPDVEESQRLADEVRRKYDTEARRLIDVFRSKVYDPARDGGLKAAAGTVEASLDGASGTCDFTFDASKPIDDQVDLKVRHAAAGFGDAAAAQAKRFVVLAVRGPHSQVLSHVPPIQWTCSRSQDGATIVVAPPFKSDVSVSYRLDADGVVSMRGEAATKRTSRTSFTWTPRGPLRLLSRSVEDEGKAAIEYVYEERDTIPLLARASLTEGLHRFDAKLTWSRVERR